MQLVSPHLSHLITRHLLPIALTSVCHSSCPEAGETGKSLALPAELAMAHWQNSSLDWSSCFPAHCGENIQVIVSLPNMRGMQPSYGEITEYAQKDAVCTRETLHLPAGERSNLA